MLGDSTSTASQVVLTDPRRQPGDRERSGDCVSALYPIAALGHQIVRPPSRHPGLAPGSATTHWLEAFTDPRRQPGDHERSGDCVSVLYPIAALGHQIVRPPSRHPGLGPGVSNDTLARSVY